MLKRLAISRGTNVRDVRRVNQAALLRRLFFDGPVSRQELARKTGLSPGTVTTVVGELIGQGMLTEAGTEDSDGGRPRTLLRVASDRGLVTGIEIGETRVRVEVFDLALRKLGAADRPVNGGHRDPAWLIDVIADAFAEALRAGGDDLPPVLGVGVGVSGIVEGSKGVVHAPSFGWEGVPLGALLGLRLGAPVIVDNGAKALGQAEVWLGAGRGAQHVAVTLLGTGVGAAIFTDGQLYRGAHSSAGEWGHTPIIVGGRACRCGSRGCLEAYVGGGPIAEEWTSLCGDVDWRRGDQEAAVGDLLGSIGRRPEADELLERLTEQLGAGLATLVNLFNPERIILSGWVGQQLAPRFLDRIRARTSSYALQRPFGQVQIVPGELGPDAVALGAATLVVDQILVGGLPLLNAPPASPAPSLYAGVRS